MKFFKCVIFVRDRRIFLLLVVEILDLFFFFCFLPRIKFIQIFACGSIVISNFIIVEKVWSNEGKIKFVKSFVSFEQRTKKETEVNFNEGVKLCVPENGSSEKRMCLVLASFAILYHPEMTNHVCGCVRSKI